MKTQILFLLLLLCGFLNAQYLKKEYPLTVQYVNREAFNLRLSVSRNSDFEGAESISIEIPSLSFTVFQNPTNTSEMVYSLNPLIWCISTLSNSGSMRNSGGGVPLFNALLEGLPNLKIDIVLYKSLSLNFGVDMDYLLQKKVSACVPELLQDLNLKYPAHQSSYYIIGNQLSLSVFTIHIMITGSDLMLLMI